MLAKLGIEPLNFLSHREEKQRAVGKVDFWRNKSVQLCSPKGVKILLLALCLGQRLGRFLPLLSPPRHCYRRIELERSAFRAIFTPPRDFPSSLIRITNEYFSERSSILLISSSNLLLFFSQRIAITSFRFRSILSYIRYI